MEDVRYTGNIPSLDEVARVLRECCGKCIALCGSDDPRRVGRDRFVLGVIVEESIYLTPGRVW